MDGGCSFKFSSEYLDSETGLVYYNYRYYSPELGRWTKRDPIAIVGSTAWWADNKDRQKLYGKLRKTKKRIYQLYSLATKYEHGIPLHYIQNSLESLKEELIFIQYEINMDLLGKRNNGNNGNPYNHTGNNPFNRTDRNGTIDPVIVALVVVFVTTCYVLYKIIKKGGR